MLLERIQFLSAAVDKVVKIKLLQVLVVVLVEIMVVVMVVKQEAFQTLVAVEVVEVGLVSIRLVSIML